MMFRKNVFGLTLVLMGLLSGPSVYAMVPNPCSSNQEAFGFEFENYGIKHQGGAMLDISVDYRYIHTAEIKADTYPDFIPIANAVDQFLKTYPNEWDYWEIVNRKLVNHILIQYPTLTSMRIKLSVESGSSDLAYKRHSDVMVTRPGLCPLLTQN